MFLEEEKKMKEWKEIILKGVFKIQKYFKRQSICMFLIKSAKRVRESEIKLKKKEEEMREQ